MKSNDKIEEILEKLTLHVRYRRDEFGTVRNSSDVLNKWNVCDFKLINRVQSKCKEFMSLADYKIIDKAAYSLQHHNL